MRALLRGILLWIIVGGAGFGLGIHFQMKMQFNDWHSAFSWFLSRSENVRESITTENRPVKADNSVPETGRFSPDEQLSVSRPDSAATSP